MRLIFQDNMSSNHFPMLLLLLHCFIINGGSALRVTNLTSDQSALLAFKAHVTFHPQSILASNWSTSAPVCNWVGVSCGGRHGRVRALDLTNMDVGGTLPPQLGNLSFLVSLNLSHNFFHGYLPKELGQLHRLKFIDLTSNHLSGEIPFWFGDLQKLRYLVLRNNSFRGAIPNTLFNISNLEELYLSFNSIEGMIPNEIGKLPNLRILAMYGNKLHGSIPSSIFNMSSLEVVDLSHNSLSGNLYNMCNFLSKLEWLTLSSNQLSGKLPSSLYKCSQLQVLSLSLNNFKGQISRNIGNLTKLRVINLGGNNLQGVIPWEVGNLLSLEIFAAEEMGLTGPIPSTIFNISSLKEIRLQQNNLSGSLPDDMCNHLPKLEWLTLNSNQLSGKLSSSLDKCSELQVLKLTSNKFTGQISRNIGNLTKLRQIYLGYNNLQGEIPGEIGNLRHLEKLHMAFNKLTGSLPLTIFNISSIRVISLEHNFLSGYLPPSMGLGVPNLEEIYLWENSIGGIIPDSIGNASQLRILELTRNSFLGPIPNTLGNLRFLQQLALGNNNLTIDFSNQDWTFLTSLTNCRELRVLDVSHNPLNSTIPTSIGNLSTSLEHFAATNCKIKGHILSEIGNLSNLIALSLDENELSGPIPTTLGRLQELQGLDLGANMLEETIPFELCQLAKLDALLLMSNNLDGPIPSCFFNLTSLRYLYMDSNKFNSTLPLTFWSLSYILEVTISSNSLSGFLPPDVGNLKVMTIFDISRNQLSGNLPGSIGGLNNLRYLSLANNDLRGPIPQSFGDLISLEGLDLSCNNLSGVIPKSLQALTYLQEFNVSFNRLEGEIPTGGPFKKFSAESFKHNNALCGASWLQVPLCKSRNPRPSKMSTSLLLKCVLPIIASAILVMVAIFIIRYQRKNTKKKKQEIGPPLVAWRRVSYLELQHATSGFNELNLLGVGAFGSVYKGTLSDGKDIAVKIFDLQLDEAFRSFDVECEVLRNLRHRNLVKIITSCSINLDFKALILEFMPNGSLEKWLYSHNYFLDILQRLNIMIDVASALEYLHHGYSTPVVHCDLKPSNVLLNEDMVACVSDFGIAKLLGEGKSMTQTMMLATIGYMAPEYGSLGIISTKGDVYSYGILLMETFTRKKPTDDTFVGDLTLKNWVKELLSHAATEIVDANLLTGEEGNCEAKIDCMSSILKLALDCSSDLPEERRNMKDVLAMLKKIRKRYLKHIER